MDLIWNKILNYIEDYCFIYLILFIYQYNNYFYVIHAIQKISP